MALRFAHISVENWRNFSRAKADLQRRIFLVGPNASGKSNFLDIFRFLRDVASVGGGFQAAVNKRGGVSAIRCLAARRNPQIGIKVDIRDDGSNSCWEYELRFTQRSTMDRPIVVSEVVSRDGKQLLSRPVSEDQADRDRLIQTYLEQVNVNREFREVANFFASVRYFHIIPQLIREPELALPHPKDPFGSDLLEQIARVSKRRQTDLLRRICEALRVAVPQFRELKLNRDNRGVPHLIAKYQHWRAQGGWQGENQFSDGTLRLIGLLWAALDEGGPLLLEEPELSLHPGVVRFIPSMFSRIQSHSGRQVLISTHSPELLADEGIGLDEVFLLTPSSEGTSLSMAGSDQEIRTLLASGANLSELVIPKTEPVGERQLSLFFEE